MSALGLIDEGKASILDYLNDFVCALIDRPVTIFVTSTNWGRLLGEIKARTDQMITGNKLIIRRCTVVNAGTEDQRAVNEANLMHAEGLHFSWKRDNLRVK